MAVQVNDEAIEHLSSLIDEGRVADGAWVEARPSNDEEIAYIEEHGWDAFARWHLALDTAANRFSMRRYEYLVGDFEKVYVEALEAAYERAGRLGFTDIEKSAQKLLTRTGAFAPKQAESKQEKVNQSE